MNLLCLLLLAFVLSPVSLLAGPHEGSSHGNHVPGRVSEGIGQPYVLLISIDGFRADYLDRFDLPNFRRLIREGIRADGLIPVFPSVTAPNHYSIVTGLYPERHGIVGNAFYDPQREQVFNHQTHHDGTWYRGQPLWVTAETQGMTTACYLWIGCEANIRGIQPTYRTSHDHQVPNEARVDQVLSWLQLPVGQRPHFIGFYMTDEVDAVGHWYGPEPIEVGYVVRRVDAELGYLLDRLRALPNHDEIYVVIVSDHGMAEVRPEHVVTLNDPIDSRTVRMILSGPYAHLYMKDASTDPRALCDEINQWLTHGRAYLRSDMPVQLHHRTDPRVGDIIIVMDQPFVLGQSLDEEPWGQHGWDPSHSEMHGIFLTMGPDIKQGVTIPAFENVHIYPFLAEVLSLKTSPDIDGRSGWLKQLITE